MNKKTQLLKVEYSFINKSDNSHQLTWHLIKGGSKNIPGLKYIIKLRNECERTSLTSHMLSSSQKYS